MVGFYMTTQDHNVKPNVERVKVPKHKALIMIHNVHVTMGLTIEEAFEKGIDGFEDDDWINSDEKHNCRETGNHWMLKVFPTSEAKYYVHSASDIGVLLEHVSELKRWKQRGS
jgi:hypothetical protein